MADETVRPLLEQGAICRLPRVHVATGQIRARGEEGQPGEQEHRSQDLKPFGKRNGDGQAGSIQERAACEAVNGESDREDRRRSELDHIDEFRFPRCLFLRILQRIGALGRRREPLLPGEPSNQREAPPNAADREQDRDEKPRKHRPPLPPNRSPSHIHLLGTQLGQTLKSRLLLSADRMPSEEDEMLSALGVRSVEDLFADIPAPVRIPKLDIPDGLPEDRVVARVTSMLAANRTVVDMPAFLGGGLYDHFVPASVRAVVSRTEIYTSYTPYQPEISQGLLQALWEYQSLICDLTGMDAANTSMYDGSTALGEAARMAHRIHGGRIFLIPRALRHNRRAVLANYVVGAGIEVREVDYDRESGMLDLAKLKASLSSDVCGVYVENPNFFGRFEEQLEEIRAVTDGVLVVGVNPIAQAVVRPPGDFGADIVVGEGQPLGTQMNFGGPLLGVFACRQQHIRKKPGRVIGLTRDAKGHRAFCMTLQTREQHIRREKTMSNICTNESLLAVAAATYMAVLGSNGLRRVAAENIRRAKELAGAIDKITGFEAPLFHGAHFNQFVGRREKGYAPLHPALLERGIQGGLPPTPPLPELSDAALFATTGRHTPEAVQRLLGALEAFR